jgi:hypothetical protein
MSDENRPVTREDGSIEIRTPAKLYISPDAGSPSAGTPAPMAGAQNGNLNCQPFHQFICVSGEVTTTVTPTCTTRVCCLNGGVGPSQCPQGTPQPCTFKFFQNLCVEVDVTIDANAQCVLNEVQCLGADNGPCPCLD